MKFSYLFGLYLSLNAELVTAANPVPAPTAVASPTVVTKDRPAAASSPKANPKTKVKIKASKIKKSGVNAPPTELERFGKLNDDGTVVCPTRPNPIPDLQRAEVYAKSPYKQGEVAEFEVSYMGALVGTARMEVRPPIKYPAAKKLVWHRSFHIDASTGEWYKMIFVAHDVVDSYVRPWDHGISRFYIDQDEGKLFGRRFQQKKWLEFDQEGCKVHERTAKGGKPEETKSFPLSYGTMDTLGISYWMREQQFKVGQKIRGLVYSSEKNWWLEADPLAEETVETKAGKFPAMKLKLQTYIGKDLQQKGDVYVWIAHQSPQRQIVAIKADIKLGSVRIDLAKYTAGP